MSKSNKNVKTLGQKYQKRNLHEQILEAPDTFIGSIDDTTCKMWVFNDDAKGETEAKIVLREINYVPGFYKICDEIFVNAADHTKRCKTCTIIKITIDQQTGMITVWNNGDGIDVADHPEHKIMIPYMLFGDLLTSTNYNKNEKKIVGGKNGFGAKLANIYSVKFIVDTVDATRSLRYYQEFADNMYTKSKAKIRSVKCKPYTKISFIPDFKKFGLKGITDDMLSLLKKRVYDLAMTTSAKVYFNDKIIAQNNFTKYIDLYFPVGSEHKKVIDVSTHQRWKVCVVFDPTDQIEHQNISFVNSICTSRGGTHVDQIVNQIVRKLKETVEKKLKGVDIKPAMIKENLLFFIDATIVNPDFDTQTKEFLTTKTIKFGSNFTVSDAFVKKICRTGVIDQIVTNAQAKAEANMNKITGRNGGTVRLAKLYGAHKAGTREGYKCTLILTEGDSAKGFAMSGLNVIGRDYYGVFPLRGKLLNVRDESPTKIAKNEEIKAIIKIMGLEPKKVYQELKGLKYGSIMVLADADVDGFHIKGLIMNFVHKFWPSLIKFPGFIKSFATPLLKATKGKNILEFTSPQTFDGWKNENNDGKGWKIKYYKGLGTSTAAEAQACFKNLDNKQQEYFWETAFRQFNKKPVSDKKTDSDKKKSLSDTHKINSEFIDEETDLVGSTSTMNVYQPKNKDASEDAMTLAFAKDRSDDRKIWVNMYDPTKYIDSSEKKISYYDFIHRELITFSVEDNIRSIPNIMDGFKPVQRKVYHGSVKKNIYKEEIKVSPDLQGYVSTETKYHHGDQSLCETIIAMAQDFVGSNNINLLMPIGQFGTRLCGGEDHASARYLHTKLNMLGRKIFREEDTCILNELTEDNKKIEPVFFTPIIPMILVNGSEGIGTGYSTKIKPCNPRDIYLNLIRIIRGEKFKPMKPWYRHFTGTIEKVEPGKYIARAKYEIIGDDTIHITDLPIGVWTDNYKAFLDNLLEESLVQKAEEKKEIKRIAQKKNKTKKPKAGSKRQGKNAEYLAKRSRKSATAKVAKTNPIASSIKTYTEDCTEIRVDFTIVFYPGKLKTFIAKGTLEKNLKLVTNLNLTNMHLFDENGKIRKYNSYKDILENFAKVRLNLYQKRKDYLMKEWRKELDILQWKLKFVKAVIAEEIIVFKKTSQEIINQLEENKFPKFAVADEKNPTYGYLTNMSIIRFSKDEIKKLEKQIEDKEEELAILEGKTPSQIWEDELEEFIKEYDEWENTINLAYQALMRSRQEEIDKGKRKRRQSKKNVENGA